MPLLFSYGTLQQNNVQLSIFGRLLKGEKDQLIGYNLSLIPIDEPEVIATSGKTHHPIVKYTGNKDNRVDGTIFEVTDDELKSADKYEISAYKRVLGDFSSGKKAWVYIART